LCCTPCIHPHALGGGGGGRRLQVHTFNTVEDFWRLYTHIKRPSALENNINMYFFRDAAHYSE
jgi:Eukaryotic initiation factor 4E